MGGFGRGVAVGGPFGVAVDFTARGVQIYHPGVGRSGTQTPGQLQGPPHDGLESTDMANLEDRKNPSRCDLIAFNG